MLNPIAIQINNYFIVSILGQSQSKTEIKFCKELQRHGNYGFHFFKIFTDKKLQHSKLLGIHIQGIFLFEATKELSVAHLVQASFFWHKITRIQYDSGKFHLLVQDDHDKSKSQKFKYYAEECKSKVMFDVSSAHHQHSNQIRLNAKMVSKMLQFISQPTLLRNRSRFLERVWHKSTYRKVASRSMSRLVALLYNNPRLVGHLS